MIRTMTARYAGTCRVCGEPITVGSPIVFKGRGHSEHSACTAAAVRRPLPFGLSVPDVIAWNAAEDQRLATLAASPAGTHQATRSTRYGRCEDAPCCGCCD